MKHLLVVGALCAAVLCMAQNAHAFALVDHFTDGYFDLSVDGVTGAFPAVATDDQTGLAVLGGERKVTLTWISGTPGTGQAIVQNVLPEHFLDFNNTTGVRTQLLLEYPILANSGTTVDMLGQNCVQLEIEFLQSDLGSNITFTVEDGSATSFAVTKPAAAGANTFIFLFSEFTGVDFSDVAYISLDIDAVNSGDYRIDSIECSNVPEPITMLGLMLGLGGVGAYIRKRRMA